MDGLVESTGNIRNTMRKDKQESINLTSKLFLKFVNEFVSAWIVEFRNIYTPISNITETWHVIFGMSFSINKFAANFSKSQIVKQNGIVSSFEL